MKFCVFATIAMVLCVGAFYTAQAAKVCVVRLSECRSTNTTCARVGSSSLCKKFANNCQLGLANCRSNINYNAVADRFCSAIAVNQQGACRGSLTSSSTTNLGAILSALGGSSSNIQPIVINRG